MGALLLTIPSGSDDGEKKIEVGLPGKPRIPGNRFMPSIDSAENSKPPGLIRQDDFAGMGAIDVITPPISLVWLTSEGVVAPGTVRVCEPCWAFAFSCLQDLHRANSRSNKSIGWIIQKNMGWSH